MKQSEVASYSKVQSQKELLYLHAALNKELDKFNKALTNESNHSHMDTLHSIRNRIHIMKNIQQINKQIQEMTTVRKKRKAQNFIA